MLCKIYRKGNKFFLVKLVFFVVCCFSLTACSRFMSFPVSGVTSDHGPYFYLQEKTRIVYSLGYYAYILAIFATIPLYIAKSFENRLFYKIYKKFWWVGVVVFQALISMLVGFIPVNMGFMYSLIIYSIISASVLLLTLAPAAYQHNKKNKPKKW